MNKTVYEGQALKPNGIIIHVTGTIEECANWADNLIRAHGGEIEITIRRKVQ